VTDKTMKTLLDHLTSQKLILTEAGIGIVGFNI